MAESAPSASPEARLAAARARVAAEARKARVALTLERAVRALWPLWGVISLFLGLALLGVPQALPFWGHVALLVATAGGIGAALWFAWRRMRLPTDHEARARLDAATADRPVAAIDDALAVGAAEPSTQALWVAHQARMAERAAALKAEAADLRVSAEDRFALRHAAALALAAGIIAQLGDGGARLVDALVPSSAAATQEARAPSFEAWASPPVYTGVAPLYLTERVLDPAPVSLPRGTEVTLRVFDSPKAPVLETAGTDTAPAFVDQGGGTWSATVRLDTPIRLGARAGDADFGGWTFDVIPDTPPTIQFTSEPTQARSGGLEFAFTAADDYGVVSARAEIVLDASAQRRGFVANSVFEPIAFDLPVPQRSRGRDVPEAVEHDLIEHPWGGLPVVLRIIAEDGAGQTAIAEHRLAQPQRTFVDKLARAIIEERRSLAWSLDGGRRVHRVLEAVTAYPEEVVEDVTAYMTLRTAIRRLDYALREDRLVAETPSIAELLWLAALRIEEGDLSAAEQRLRRLQQELSDAIERGASEDEIAQLMQELREAMNDFLRELAEQAQRNQQQGQQQPQQPIDPNNVITQQDLQDLLSQIEEMLRNGQQEMAQEMLRRLQEMLQNLQMAQPGQQQQQGQGGQGDQAMRELQDMIDQQQGLADRSFDALRQGQQQGQQQGRQPGQQGQQGQGQRGQQGQQGQGQQGQQGQGQRGQGQQQGQRGQGQGPGDGQGQSPGGTPDLGAIARDQEALRRMLDGLRGQMPGPGSREALDRAERSMGEARDALEQGDANGALQNQVEALDALREGAQQLAQESQQGQPGEGQQAGRDGRGGNVRDEDPFGRPRATDGPLDGDSVRVPDGSVMKRARELMDEIRRRAGERSRPELELDYLQRLLDRF